MSDRLWEEAPTVSFRPSYSATTLLCPGSLRPSLEAQDTAGYEAAVGTVFHAMIAEWQLTNSCPRYLLNRVQIVEGHEVTIDEEMFVNGEECLARFRHFLGDRFVETRVDISSLTPIPGQSGTLDLSICSLSRLVIVDWKYGKGVKVYARDNTQLQCYAWGMFEKYDWLYDFQVIEMWIAQPRLNHFEVWEISRDELLAFAEWARGQWAVAWSGDAPRIPSPKACQWCRLRTRCPAQQALLTEIVSDSFPPPLPGSLSTAARQQLVHSGPVAPAPPPAGELSTLHLAQIYQYRGMIERWFRAVGEELLERGMRGDDLGGLWKVGIGRQGNRQWVNEEVAAWALGQLGVDEDRLWTRELISPPAVEVLLRGVGIKGGTMKQALSLHTERAPGKPTLMPVEDSRMSIDELVAESFEV